VGRIWRCFFSGFVLGITHEIGVPFFVVILPLKSHRKAFDFGGFRVVHVLEVEARDLRFRELYGVRGCNFWCISSL
jgi:hypothetical protein